MDASRGLRFVAFLIDGFVLLAVPLSAAVLSGISILLPVFVAVLAAQLWLLHAEAQTIGKALCGLRIARCDGRRPGLLRIVALRTLLPGVIALIPFLGLLFVIADFAALFDDDRRSLHDHVADTRVVRAR